MIIDTRTKEGMESSLASYFGITTVNTLKNCIYFAENTVRKGKKEFDIFEFSDELHDIMQPKERIDEIYVYHLTRRLNNTKEDFSTKNLKDLLLTDCAVSKFLYEHNITFVERDGHPILFYNNKEVDLGNEDGAGNLEYRLGYDTKETDYCFNGFVMKDLLMKNYYARSLKDCPEFIKKLSACFNDDTIEKDYKKNSKYYCFTYKFKIEELIVDTYDSVEDVKEKENIFIATLCNRLYYYMIISEENLFDSDNLVVRVNDDINISANYLVNIEEITDNMI